MSPHSTTLRPGCRAASVASSSIPSRWPTLPCHPSGCPGESRRCRTKTAAHSLSIGSRIFYYAFPGHGTTCRPAPWQSTVHSTARGWTMMDRAAPLARYQDGDFRSWTWIYRTSPEAQTCTVKPIFACPLFCKPGKFAKIMGRENSKTVEFQCSRKEVHQNYGSNQLNCLKHQN